MDLELLQPSSMAGHRIPTEHQQQHLPTKMALQMVRVLHPSRYALATSQSDSSL